MACAICEARRPRRFCPGVRGEICTVCCGTEREVSVDCPFECVYLQEARKHERTDPVDPETLPNQDIPVTEEFLHHHEELALFLGQSLLRSALETPGAVDSDVADALAALIRTFRTLDTGLLYETRPDNAFAAAIAAHVQKALADFRSSEPERTGMVRTRDSEVLGVLVFLQRLALDRANGRRRGRAFLDFLRGEFGTEAPAKPASLIVP